jgi:hypothetical protein
MMKLPMPHVVGWLSTAANGSIASGNYHSTTELDYTNRIQAGIHEQHIIAQLLASCKRTTGFMKNRSRAFKTNAHYQLLSSSSRSNLILRRSTTTNFKERAQKHQRDA